MKKILFPLAILFFLTSCEDLLFEKDLATSDPFQNFDYLADQVDKKYSYFELKGIDWETVQTEYRKKLYAGMSEDSLFTVLANMLNELRDDHVNLVSPFNISMYNVQLTGPANVHPRTILEHYLLDDLRVTGAFLHGFIANKQVGYMNYSSFMANVDNESLDHILTRYKDTQGLILDLRANGGGSVVNIPLILERFTPDRRLVGYSITRNGPKHTDFSQRENFFIGRHDGIRYTKPVMVLIDRGSYSATTFFALATKAFPNITLIGDTTGGGGGLPGGGQLPNGWTFRLSVSQLLDLEGNNYAEEGVPPDIFTNFDWADLTKDEIIERAISEITGDR